MLPRSILAVLVGLTLLLTSAVAAAQTDQERAVALANEAQEAFANRDYERAAEKFAQAYSFYPDHSLQMNEMVSWYKATRCEQALEVGNRIVQGKPTLSEQDESDLDKVYIECGYDEAQRMFDAGELDAAEARLNLVHSTNIETAQKVGVLRGKIEERRNVLTTQDDQQVQDVQARNEIEAPPSSLKTTGFALLGGGAAAAVAAAVKVFIENRQLARQQAYWAADTSDPAYREGDGVSPVPCEFGDQEDRDLPSCSDIDFPPGRASADDPPDPNFYEAAVGEAESSRRLGRTTSIVIGGLGLAGVAAGTGILVYYYSRQSKWEQSQSVDAAVRAPVLVPTFGPDGIGFSALWRF